MQLPPVDVNKPLLTVADRDSLVGYLRLLDDLIAGPETAHRLTQGLIRALENR